MSRNASSFYWYDLETSGTEPRWDRIVQFAGLRTDMELNEVGDEFSCYVELPDDVLPSPAATVVTGITPAVAARGSREWDVLTRVLSLVSRPRTCVTGYNNLRFDDEFLRYGFYRMLLDPYAREWQNNNSRWDIIDLVRATGALRREGIEWPQTEEGQPAYNLELMTRANKLEHGQAHDAMSDVRATLAVARLIRRAQPRLFDYYFDLRFKKGVRALLEPYGARVCLHVSGMYPRERYCSAPVMSICRHPTNSNSIVVVDLSQDPESLLSWTPEAIRERLFERGAIDRPPLKEIRINRCPFVAGIEVLNEENWSRMGFDRRLVNEHARRLRKPGIAQRIMRVYQDARPAESTDPDAALYDALLQDPDRNRCASFQAALAEGRFEELDFQDPRLSTLVRRLKARSFPELLQPEEAAEWREFVVAKLNAGEAPWRTLESFRAELDAERARVAEAGDTRAERILAELATYGNSLAERYPA